MTEINIPLLRKAVEWVESEAAKEHWFQREWSQQAWMTFREPSEYETMLGHPVNVCGTAYCVAGYVAQLVNPAYAQDEFGYTQGTEEPRHSSDVARAALGITLEQSRGLFYAANDAATVRRVAEEIAGGAL